MQGIASVVEEMYSSSHSLPHTKLETIDAKNSNNGRISLILGTHILKHPWVSMEMNEAENLISSYTLHERLQEIYTLPYMYKLHYSCHNNGDRD